MFFWKARILKEFNGTNKLDETSYLVFAACFIEAKDPLGPLILHDVAGSLASYLFLGQLCSSTIELV